MTNPAIFSTQLPQEQVTLCVEPGTPDVLSLLTTNIPLVHSRLTELRQRKDHPQNHPRQVWVDLSHCENFAEVRGDILVRALRLTQFLPAGFIGEGAEVEEMARVAHLPRVSSSKLLPRSTAKLPSTVSRIEIEQAEDITVDLRRRLTATQAENTSNCRRAEVLSQALGVVREQRDRLEGEISDLNTRLASMSGQLEWSSVQHQSAEAEVANVIERLNLAIAAQHEASSRAQALEDGMSLVEQALFASRHEAWELQNKVAEMEQGGVATAEEFEALSQSVREFEEINAQLNLDLATREDAFMQQRNEFNTANGLLSDQVQKLQGALAAAQEDAARERDNAVVLVQSRDEVEKQATLTSQMLEDALARVEELTNDVSTADQSLSHFRDQWQSLSLDHQQAREQLLVVQEEARQANQDVVSLSAQCQEQAEKIQALCGVESASSTDLAAAKVRSEGLASALEAAQERATQAQSDLDQALSTCEDLRTQVSDLQEDASKREVDIQALTRARDEALEASVAISSQRDEINADLVRVNQELVTARAETVFAQDCLLESSRETTQLQTLLDETRRANEVVNELVGRQSSELRAAHVEIEDLNAQMTLWCEKLETAQGLHDQELGSVNAQVIELTARLAQSAEDAHQATARHSSDRVVAQDEIRELSAHLATATREAEAANTANTQIAATLAKTQSTLEDAKIALDAQASKAQEDAVEFDRRLRLAQAEGESLSRRLVVAQEQAKQSTLDLEQTIASLRAKVDTQDSVNERLEAALLSARNECVELRATTAAAVAVRVELEAHTRALEAQLANLVAQVRGLEGTIVEQEQQIQRTTGELASEKASSTQLRDQVSSGEAIIARQQEQLESSRQSIVQRTSDLHAERQQHTATRQERDAALGEVQELTQAVEVQTSTIVRLTGDLVEIRETCSEQIETITRHDALLAEANSAARAERRARASLEVELTQAQDELSQAAGKAALPASSSPATRHTARVRSGQRVSAPGDLVVVQAVSTCAELLARGSVHIYGAMHGRVHAGCEGDRSARIYCMEFNAEQVAIAGRLVVFETIPAELLGRPVEVWLDEASDTMQVRPLAAQ